MTKRGSWTSWGMDADREASFSDLASEQSAGMMLVTFRSRWEDAGPASPDERFVGGNDMASLRTSIFVPPGDSSPLAMSSFPATIDLASLDGTNGVRLDGIDFDDRSGYSVSSAGDVNGDGFDDIIIGAYGADSSDELSVGACYVVFGRADGIPASFNLAVLDGNNGFRLEGVDAYDGIGRSISSAGDVNGDGFDDIIIGASSAGQGDDYFTGESYVVFGKAGGFAASFDLAALDGNNGFRLDGIDAFDQSGSSVSSGGDINGDGFDDIIVGARSADPGGDSAAGESYVVFGKADGFAASLNLATLDGNNGFRIDGIDASDSSGRAISDAGDMNGDGFDDIIIGASGADPGGDSDAGESYVVFGRANGFAASVNLATLDGSSGFRIDGVDAGDNSGRSVASAGDINGDGFDDIIIGAFLANVGGENYAGESYVVFGKADGFAASLDLATLNGSNGFRIDGVDASDNSGRLVASAGDVNGDGFDDIIIGASNADPGDNNFAGESYVVFGKAGGFDATFDLATLDGTNGFRLDGIDNYDRSGISVSSAGDVNGDGFDDIAIGAFGAYSDEVIYSGETYVVFGRAPDEAVRRVGSAADQTIRGGDFNDALFGKGGDDTLAGGVGADTLNGGSGRDSADYGTADARVRAALGAPDNNKGEAAGDTFISIENLRGSSFDDKLSGDALGNRIVGNAGMDALSGQGGDDTLVGGAGQDSLKGGEGADRFKFASLFAEDADTISDFAGGVDRIAFDDVVFGFTKGALPPGSFVIGGVAQDADDRVIYNDATGNLFFDADGTGAQAQVLIAALTGAPIVTAADIVVI